MVAGRPGSRTRLLVLGAGPAQLGLLEAARQRGDLHVIAVDRDPHAVGLPLADERALISSEDEEAIDRLARAREVDGIVSPGADWPVGIAARVADRLGVPHPLTPETAAVATSKLRQRARFAEAGVPHPRAHEDWSDASALTYPLVVKAPDRQGQRGLTRVADAGELAQAVEQARQESRGGGVLVEEVVDGPEVTVNAISIDGAFVPLLVTDRRLASSPAFGVALAHVWPTQPALDSDLDAIRRVAQAAVEAVGIRNGPSYTQLRVGPNGPVVMEVAARLGGGHDAELVTCVTGFDLAAAAVAFALGEEVAAPRSRRSEPASGGACVSFLVPPQGVLRAVDGVAAAADEPGVQWVRVYRRPGHVFGPLLRGADRAGAILVTGASADDALNGAQRAAARVRFVVG